MKQKTDAERFLENLDDKIAFHRNITNDPHNIGNAALCVLIEVRNAYADAHGKPVVRFR